MLDEGLPRRSHARLGAAGLAAVGLVALYGERGGGGPSPLRASSTSASETALASVVAFREVAATSCGACEGAATSALGFAFEDGWSWDDSDGAEARALSRFAAEYGVSLSRSRSRSATEARAAGTASLDETEFAGAGILGKELAFALRLTEGVASTPGEVCARVGACVSPSSASASATATLARASSAPRANVIVAKAHAARGNYDLVRVTRTSEASDVSDSAVFDYDEPFKYRWTQLRVATGLVEVDGDDGTTVDVGGGRTVTVQPPKEGAGSVGVLLSDPCFASTYVLCSLGVAFDTGTRTPALLNALLEGPAARPAEAAAYWAMLGDDLYDRDGQLTASWWNALSDVSAGKLFLTTAGNHDLWIDGNPGDATQRDQFGNGFVQFYGQDSVAALYNDAVAGDDAGSPFDFSVDPDAAYGAFPANVNAALADVSNLVWWTQVGNVGFAGFSSAYALNETAAYFADACDWAAAQHAAGSLDLFVIAGHWSQFGDGAASNMPTPHVHQLAATGAFGASCAGLEARGRLKYVEGHTHCNDVVAENQGWMVAAQGMSGCGAYGIAVLDTRDDFALLVNFDIANVDGFDQYDALLDCFQTKGARDCADLGTVWLNQSLADFHDDARRS